MFAVNCSWARFFRIVNLPTVPGDVLAGAAVIVVCARDWFAMTATGPSLAAAFAAAAASVFIYMFGLADNDIVGAATDKGRPIPEGKISLVAAKVAAWLCLCGAAVCGALGRLPVMWWAVAALLAVLCPLYNRTKWPSLMGLCRGVNVLCGGVAVGGELFCHVSSDAGRGWLYALVLVWTLYIGGVTKYSEGEELDAAKKRRVGMLIGGIIYLQLIALLVFTVKPFLLAGAAMLILLRLMKRLFPEVSAS